MKCTQHLDIIRSIDETYRLVERTGYDRGSRKKRFEELLGGEGHQRVGFWPASAGTMKILDIYRNLFGKIPFEVFLFDSDPDLHGREKFGYLVHAKEKAVSLGIDCILITAFLHGTAIREGVKDLEAQRIHVKALYREEDVDWRW